MHRLATSKSCLLPPRNIVQNLADMVVMGQSTGIRCQPAVPFIFSPLLARVCGGFDRQEGSPLLSVMPWFCSFCSAAEAGRTRNPGVGSVVARSRSGNIVAISTSDLILESTCGSP